MSCRGPGSSPTHKTESKEIEKAKRKNEQIVLLILIIIYKSLKTVHSKVVKMFQTIIKYGDGGSVSITLPMAMSYLCGQCRWVGIYTYVAAFFFFYDLFPSFHVNA